MSILHKRYAHCLCKKEIHENFSKKCPILV